MPYTELISERQEMAGVIHPDLHGPGEYYTAWFDHSRAHRSTWRLWVGDIAQGGTVNFDLVQATDSVGTGAKAIAAKAITQLTQAGGDSDDEVFIELRTEELDVQNRFSFVRGHLTIGAAAANAGVSVFGDNPRFAPVSVAGVTEIVP